MFAYNIGKRLLTRNVKQIHFKLLHYDERCKALPYLFCKNHKFNAATSYGGRKIITMIPGCGIGPELMEYVRDICFSCGAPIDFDIIEIDPNLESNDDINMAICSMQKHLFGIKGQISVTEGNISKEVLFHRDLDLFVNIVHCKSLRGVEGKFKDVDIVVIRQNTEGEYQMLEHENVHGVIECLKVITRKTSSKVARYAFEYAKLHERKKVTCIHKANIMKLSDGLFLEVATAISKDYPDIEFESMIVDAACMQAVMNPHRFDIILTINLYGNILLHTFCGLIGGHATIYGTNLSDNHVVFELGTRSIAKEMIGSNMVNPVPIILATAAMLKALGHKKHSVIIKKSLFRTILDDGVRTKDWGGNSSSSDVVDATKNRILKYVPIF